MKKVAILLVVLFAFFVIISIVFSFSYKNDLRRASSLWDTIDYSEGFAVCKPKIDEIIGIYKAASQKHKHVWAVYDQQIQYLRYLYYMYNFYTWEQFIQQDIEIYEQWFAVNPNDKKHLFSYGIRLLETDRKDEGIKILSELYNPECEYEYEIDKTFDAESLKNFFCGLILNKLSKEQFKGTFYEEFFDYSVKDIIGMIDM